MGSSIIRQGSGDAARIELSVKVDWSMLEQDVFISSSPRRKGARRRKAGQSKSTKGTAGEHISLSIGKAGTYGRWIAIGAPAHSVRAPDKNDQAQGKKMFCESAALSQRTGCTRKGKGEIYVLGGRRFGWSPKP